MLANWLVILAYILAGLGVLQIFLKIKILPVPTKAMNLLMIVGAGLLLVNYVVPLLSVEDIVGDKVAATYEITPEYDSSITYTAGANLLQLTTTNNVTAGTTSPANIDGLINFTVARTDISDVSAVFAVKCDIPNFKSEADLTDVSSYNIVERDNALRPKIKICGQKACTSYSYREKTYISGGETTAGQSIDLSVTFTYSTTGLTEMNNNTAKDVTCVIAGDTWSIRTTKLEEN